MSFKLVVEPVGVTFLLIVKHRLTCEFMEANLYRDELRTAFYAVVVYFSVYIILREYEEMILLLLVGAPISSNYHIAHLRGISAIFVKVLNGYACGNYAIVEADCLAVEE